jgi:hypothetical protein
MGEQDGWSTTVFEPKPVNPGKPVLITLTRDQIDRIVEDRPYTRPQGVPRHGKARITTQGQAEVVQAKPFAFSQNGWTGGVAVPILTPPQGTYISVAFAAMQASSNVPPTNQLSFYCCPTQPFLVTTPMIHQTEMVPPDVGFNWDLHTDESLIAEMLNNFSFRVSIWGYYRVLVPTPN